MAQEIIALDLDGNSEVITNCSVAPLLHRLDSRRGNDLSQYGWNEIVVDGRGNTYLNNICFDFMGGGEFAPGIIALATPDGSVRQMADGLAFPNGMAVTPDNSTLVVAESFAGRLSALEIADDGSLSNRRVWAELGQGGDGICLDEDGAVWAAA